MTKPFRANCSLTPTPMPPRKTRFGDSAVYVKPEKPERTERQDLIDKLDRAFSLYIRRRDRCCVICGESRWRLLEAGHFYSRRYYAIRWDARNAHAQCIRCNRRHNRDQMPYLNFMLKRYDGDVLSELHTLRMDAKFKWTDEQLREKLDYFTEAARIAA